MRLNEFDCFIKPAQNLQKPGQKWGDLPSFSRSTKHKELFEDIFKIPETEL